MNARLYPWLLAFAFTVLLGGVGLCAEEKAHPPEALAPAQNADELNGFSYALTLDTSLEEPIQEHLVEIATLTKLSKRVPQSYLGLIKRVERDLEIFQNYLLSIGYAKATFKYTVAEATKPLHITISITPGPRFTLQGVRIHNTDGHQIVKIEPEVLKDLLGVEDGEDLDFKRLYQAQERLEFYYKQEGFPFVTGEKPTLEIDNTHNTGIVSFTVHSGPLAIIDATEIEGISQLDPTFIRNRLLWRPGDTFNQKIVDKTRRKLLGTGLVGALSIEPIKKEETATAPSDTPQKVVMRIKAADGPPRALGAGVRYATSEGTGGRLFWHHNNVRGGGEHLGLSARTSKRQSKAKIEYDVPDFLSPQQRLLNDASVTYDRQRAFHGRTDAIGTRLGRPFTENFSISLGLTGERGRLIQEGDVYRTRLVGLPIQSQWDMTEDLLNPTQGFRVNGVVTPYTGKINDQTGKLTTVKGGASAYLPLTKNTLGESPFILAGFVKAGSVLSKNMKSNVPPNKRFYAGGADSVRGYGYQLVGPLNENRVPMGGASLAECGGEIRIKTSESVGFVGFIEGGSVTREKAPDFVGKRMLWGVGVGLRYYTSIGPVRVDLAMPTQRRKDAAGKKIDAPFQFYISFGQAF